MLLEISSMLLCGGATAALVSGTGETNRPVARGAGRAGTAAAHAISVELTDAARAALADDAEDAIAAEGFVLRLDAGDTLTLTLSEGVSGHVLVVEATVALPGEEDAATAPPRARHMLCLYILPKGAQIPVEFGTIAESDLIATHGLTRLGAVDLGVAVPARSGASARPEILANRPIRSARATFA